MNIKIISVLKFTTISNSFLLLLVLLLINDDENVQPSPLGGQCTA